MASELRIYGSEYDLKAWHALCRAIGVEFPRICEQCEEVKVYSDSTIGESEAPRLEETLFLSNDVSFMLLYKTAQGTQGSGNMTLYFHGLLYPLRRIRILLGGRERSTSILKQKRMNGGVNSAGINVWKAYDFERTRRCDCTEHLETAFPSNLKRSFSNSMPRTCLSTLSRAWYSCLILNSQ